MTNPVQAIMAINPTAEVAVEADDINQITWLNGTTPIPKADIQTKICLLYTSPSPRDGLLSRMPSSA